MNKEDFVFRVTFKQVQTGEISHYTFGTLRRMKNFLEGRAADEDWQRFWEVIKIEMPSSWLEVTADQISQMKSPR